ncbi:ROK family protein [Sciscionella marina]|uniref:ROK family protein n=1 Tax=Sciscionella marina TaxID=508770 RepID=UPI00037CD6A2|nr:ROK family protein [Sciscionella marina]
MNELASESSAQTEQIWAGVDIGGSKILAVCVDENTNVLARAQSPSPAAHGATAILDAAAEAVRVVLARAGGTCRGSNFQGIGVGAAGVIDPEAGTVLAASGSFPGWTGTKITPELAARCDGLPVATDNDVNMLLLGEIFAGGDTPVRHALAVALGTGVGGALLVDGALLHGGGPGAGEIGHIGRFGDAPCTCGQIGHLESYASGRSIARRYTEGSGEQADAAEVAVRAGAGDPVAVRVFAEAGTHVGAAIADACGLLGIELAVLGGGVAGAWPLLEPAMKRSLAERPLLTGRSVEVRPARLGELGIAVGAALHARSKCS